MDINDLRGWEACFEATTDTTRETFSETPEESFIKRTA